MRDPLHPERHSDLAPTVLGASLLKRGPGFIR